MPRYLLVRETDSTNTYVKTLASTLPTGTVVYTHCQTAGRGQKGNSWEAEPGMNLTFSMLIKRPEVPVKQQFVISEAVALAIVDVVREELADISAPRVAVKWPNDIYCGDSKLCGLLIENSLDSADIEHCVIGVGLNVNQVTFVSDAPNPTSMSLIADRRFPLDDVLHKVCERIEQYCGFTGDFTPGHLHSRYTDALYRGDGKIYPFALPDGTTVNAAIADVLPDGMLILRHDDGTLHQYAFKQVKHIINNVSL